MNRVILLVPLDVSNAAHVEAMYRIRTDPDVAKYLTNPPPANFSSHEQYLREIDTNQRRIYLIMTNEEICGYCQAIVKGKEVELGWALQPNWWGKGIGSQAVSLLMDAVHKEPIFKEKTVILYVKKDNVRALELYKKHGFIIKGIDPLRDEYIMRLNP